MTVMTAENAEPVTEPDSLTYEEARDELVQVEQRLEAGGTTLEESLNLWQRGEDLARVCQARLEGARARLDAAGGEATPEGSPG